MSPLSHLWIPLFFQTPGSDGGGEVLDTWGGFLCLSVSAPEEDGGRRRSGTGPWSPQRSLSGCTLAVRTGGLRVSYRITHCPWEFSPMWVLVSHWEPAAKGFPLHVSLRNTTDSVSPHGH